MGREGLLHRRYGEYRKRVKVAERTYTIRMNTVYYRIGYVLHCTEMSEMS